MVGFTLLCQQSIMSHIENVQQKCQDALNRSPEFKNYSFKTGYTIEPFHPFPAVHHRLAICLSILNAYNYVDDADFVFYVPFNIINITSRR